MRYIIMHKTNAYWEGGAKPTMEEAQRIGAMVGGLVQSGILVGGDGLGPSSQGARVRLNRGQASVSPGPFDGKGALPARYAMYRATTVDEAAEIGAKFGRIFGDVAVDVRPVNEAWDLGFAPKPEGLTTRRYMAVVNADSASEAGTPLSAAQKADLKAFADGLSAAGNFLAIEHFQPSRNGKRLRPDPEAKKKFILRDGPFAETKELIGGFAVVEVPSLEDAVRIALDYGAAVEVEEMDIRGYQDPG